MCIPADLSLAYRFIDAETSGGGLPGWVGTIAGSLRTDNPNYTQGKLHH